MQRLHESHNLTSILATHNLSLARRANRALLLERGRLSPAMEIFAEAAYRTAAYTRSGVKSLDGHGVTRV
jgi:ABC-type bacteriocin/lantibiotic exporter with double-glycine peptidase domain